MRRSVLIVAVLVVFAFGVGAAQTYIHYDGVPLHWKGYCEARIHYGKADLVIRYWDFDAIAGLSRGDRVHVQYWTSCMDGR